MNILHHDLARKNKFPSLAIAAAVHILLIGIALHTSTYIAPIGLPIVELVPIPPQEKEKEEPTVIEEKQLPQLSDPYIPFPEVTTQNKIPDTISIKPSNPPDTSTLPPLTIGKESVISPSKLEPIFSPAKVNATACEKPEYPSKSIRLNEEGVVHLAMLIGVNGRVLDSKIEKSSGSKSLDNAAVSGLSLCQFEPAKTDGIPEKSWAKLEYVWKID